MKYYSLNQNSPKVSFSEAVVKGIASDKGLYFPEEINPLPENFYQNIEKNHYTLCVRGTGNFSARFYETLSLGRIPVLINTDCILPFANQINWREHIICIEQNELTDIDYKILDFHTSLNQDSLTHMQKMNRELWKNKFSFPGFVRQLTSNLKEAVNS